MRLVPPWMLATACAAALPPHTTAQDAEIAKGPWAEVPAVEMPTGDASIPISLLRDVADALLKRPGAKVCDPLTQHPIVGLSTEYCSTVYVAGDPNSLSWRVTEPVKGDHESCTPFFAVQDDDYPSSQVWVVGYVHNHLCSAAPSSRDYRAWPTDAFKPYTTMAEFRLTPGNPAPAVYENTLIEMASAVVAERPDGKRVFVRYFTTGEVEQWSQVQSRWIHIGKCIPRGANRFSNVPQCGDGPLRLLSE